ncbi:hypothetical protein EMCRGX_G022307 [Ephydatia muelleri]
MRWCKVAINSRTLIVLLAIAASLVSLYYFVCWKAPSAPLDLTYGIHRPVLTYLNRKRSDGRFVDAQQQATPRVPATVVDLSSGRSGAQLDVAPSVVANGGSVEVTWSGISNPRSDDWIGFFCPRDARDSRYLDHWSVAQCPTHSEGHGTVTFSLYNLRLDCEFRYYTLAGEGDDSELHLLARSRRVTFEGGPQAPVHGHLALTGDPSQMRVQWTSGTRESPTVRYGLAPNALDLTARGSSSRTYNYTDMCGPPANTPRAFVDPGYLHDVLLTDLVPGTKYYYRFGSPSALSYIATFTAPPRPGDRAPFRFLTYGDMGLTPPPGSQKVARMLTKEVEDGVAFVVHQGPPGWRQERTQVETKGKGSTRRGGTTVTIRAGSAACPCSIVSTCLIARGTSPGGTASTTGPSTRSCSARSTTSRRDQGQYSWLERDLRSVDKKITPWIVVAGHRPMYCSEDYPADYEVTLNMQQALEDLFHQYRVDLALWGHYHSYERTCPVYRNACDPVKGIVHVMVGSAGMFMVHADKYDVPWSAHFELSYGYGRVTVSNESSLLWEYVRSIDGSVGDRVWLHHH